MPSTAQVVTRLSDVVDGQEAVCFAALVRKDTIEHDATLCGFPTASRHAGQQTRRLDRTDIGIR